MNRAVLLIIASMFLLVTEAAVAEIYKWVDEEGVTHFSDNSTQGSRVETAPLNSFSAPAQGETNYTPPSYQRVELYTTTWCPYCEKARRFLRSRGVNFTEYDIEKDASAAARKKRLGSPRGVPFAVIYGQKIQGFSASRYAGALAQNR